MIGCDPPAIHAASWGDAALTMAQGFICAERIGGTSISAFGDQRRIVARASGVMV